MEWVRVVLQVAESVTVSDHLKSEDRVVDTETLNELLISAETSADTSTPTPSERQTYFDSHGDETIVMLDTVKQSTTICIGYILRAQLYLWLNQCIKTTTMAFKPPSIPPPSSI